MQTISSIDVLELSKYMLNSNTVIRGQGNHGKIFRINEYQYFGELDENDLPHGFGEMEYFGHPTIKTYVGTFYYGEKHGTGTEVYHNDSIYSGEFINGQKCGFGKLYNTNGLLKYSGQWENDVIIGEIVGFEYKNNKKIYYGSLKNGKYHGYGIEYDDDCIIRIGYYDTCTDGENGQVIKALNFHKNKNNVIIKEAQTEYIDTIINKVNNIYNNKTVTLEEIKSFDKYMISGDTQDVTRKNNKNEVYYVGSIKMVNGLIQQDVGKYFVHNAQKHVLEGVFTDYFTFGSITMKKGNNQIPIATGKFDDININHHSLDYDYIAKKIIVGKLYNTNHRSFKHWNNCSKVYFEGTFINGRPDNGELYKYVNENEQELLFRGKFESNNSINIGIFSRFKEGQLYKNNKLYYDGHFSNNGELNGRGTTFYENGTLEYVGLFSSGHRNGQGMLFDEIGNLISEGQFNHGDMPAN